MQPGTRVSDEKKKVIIAQISKDRSAGMSLKDAAKKNGLTDVTFYAWRKQLNGSSSTPLSPKVTESLACGVVQESEALRWIAANRGAHGRFSSLKEEVLSAVSRLRKNQVWTFAGPDNPKDIKPIQWAVTKAMRVASLNYVVRYYKAKNFFIVIKGDALKSNA